MGLLTTHVLDTAAGCPASGLVVQLFTISNGEMESLNRQTTNSDGRCSHPLLEKDLFKEGIYQLEFRVGEYYLEKGVVSDTLVFLDIVPVRFTISESQKNYHVPLLVAPYGYSTYRGS